MQFRKKKYSTAWLPLNWYFCKLHKDLCDFWSIKFFVFTWVYELVESYLERSTTINVWYVAFGYSDRCKNKTLCVEKLSLVLPETPPYVPRQFSRCAVIGNSGDLLKTKFGNEIDEYDVVVRENGAPIQVWINDIIRFYYFGCWLFGSFDHSLFCFLDHYRTTQTLWERRVHFASLTEALLKL